MTVDDYFQVIERKTGQLFSACTFLGAMVAGCHEAETALAAEYGRAFGIAFQITDDALDFAAEDPRWGKEIGMDVSGGKQTLPLLLALAEAGESEREKFYKHWNNGRSLDAIAGLVADHRGVERALEHARGYVESALGCLERLALKDDESAAHLAALPHAILQRVY
jgi:geranylgeranyl pyrophosphate synthase